MAQLAERVDAGSAPDPVWDRPWNAPQNEPFVRRRLTMFQNPAISELTGADGYPASHFVGVAGVGADAARLDHRSARAGIFSNDRRTRLEDIRDGAGNTLLVLGVRDQLGSWGAGGPATVRGLTSEPYLNGPDGFGTGADDAMSALMADGGVRFRSATKSTRGSCAAWRPWLTACYSTNWNQANRETAPRFWPAIWRPTTGRCWPAACERPGSDQGRPIEPEFSPEPAVPAGAQDRPCCVAQAADRPF